jgi:hypothetical protein
VHSPEISGEISMMTRNMLVNAVGAIKMEFKPGSCYCPLRSISAFLVHVQNTWRYTPRIEARGYQIITPPYAPFPVRAFAPTKSFGSFDFPYGTGAVWSCMRQSSARVSMVVKTIVSSRRMPWHP